MLYVKRLALVAAAVLMTAGAASATPLFIDFGSAQWQNHAGMGTSSASLTYGDLTVTLTASALGQPAQLVAHGGGIGITERHGKFKQIGFAEVLEVTFSHPVVIHGLGVERLADVACYGRHCLPGEYGLYSVDGAPKTVFGPGNRMHKKKVVVEEVGSSLTLSTIFAKDHLFDDYVLRGISIWPELRDNPGGQGSVPTPEPGAALLFGAGLVAVSARVRRRRF